jgi:hypothetical protein
MELSIDDKVLRDKLIAEMESWVNLSNVVQDQEQELQVLKSLKKMPKKELQIKRNRITA